MARPSWIGYKLAGRYEIQELLGQGGMAAVYRANDPNLQRMVAVKLIHQHLSNDAAFVRRFEAEATAVARLRHPKIIQVYDFAREEDVFYIVFEYVAGETLTDHLARIEAAGRSMPFERVVQIGSDIASALHYAHERGLVHRDVKPANIMLNPDGDAILMDFGIARIAGGPQHTATGAILGTVSYMAPEQVRGRKPDRRTDIYALGIVLFQLVAGRVPYEADSAMTLMMMQIREPIPDLYELRSDAPPDLVRIIRKATQKDPADRYQSAGELLADLNNVRLDADTAVPTPPVGSLVPPSKHPKPSRRPSPVTPERGQAAPPPRRAPAASSRAEAGTKSRPSGGLLSGRRTPLLGGCLAVMLLFLCSVGLYTLFGTPLGDSILGRASDEPATAVAVGDAVTPTTDGEEVADEATASATAIASATATATATTATAPAAATNDPSEPTPTMAEPTLRPTNTPTTAPVVAPTHTPTNPPPATPATGQSVRISDISLSGDRYVVSYSTVGYTEALPGKHVHFFFDTVPPGQAGLPGGGPWYVWGGPRPFNGYGPGDRPSGAGQMCALVANADHSIILGTGNCVNLP